ncbi:MAG: 4Fe-4S dicluster domain-containing protein, partial [Clostridia bacterium]|nr:4Fe-4S dicluster domain-containing protein [Clostridia bacterium]
TEGCPQKIRIPEIFEAVNKQTGDGQLEKAREAYARAVEGGGKAGDCIGCRRCENACPQHLKITEHLRTAAAMFEV